MPANPYDGGGPPSGGVPPFYKVHRRIQEIFKARVRPSADDGAATLDTKSKMLKELVGDGGFHPDSTDSS